MKWNMFTILATILAFFPAVSARADCGLYVYQDMYGDSSSNAIAENYSEGGGGCGAVSIYADAALTMPSGASYYGSDYESDFADALAAGPVSASETGDGSFDGSSEADYEICDSSLSIDFQLAIGLRLSSYQFVGVSNGRCAWSPYGVGCPGTCGSSHTTNMAIDPETGESVCYTEGRIYKSCLDVTLNGNCWIYRLICLGSQTPGSCN